MTTWRTYANTLKYTRHGVGDHAAARLRGGVVPGVSRCGTTAMQTVLFLICTVPFLTSNIIRMISWVPFLGRNGLVNQALLGLHLIDHPLEDLLFSDFSIVLAFVHLYALFMVVPVFNSMMRIDRRLVEAARDAGATGWQVLREVVIRSARPGIAIGSTFVVTLGDGGISSPCG